MEDIVGIDFSSIRLYSIYDSLSDEYGPIFQAVNDRVAQRNFRNILNQVDVSSKYDFRLYFLGYFDQKKGSIKYAADDAYIVEEDVDA